jgi:hypothetical protein
LDPCQPLLPTHSNKLALTTQKLTRNPTPKLTTHMQPYKFSQPFELAKM